MIGNYFADNYVVSKGFIEYPEKPFQKSSIHLPFDYIFYPLMLLYYNQWTLNSRPIGIILKLFPFVVPLTIIETVAAKKSNLIEWKKGWTWYHSFISTILKLLLCRSIISVIRTINTRKISIN